MAPAPFETSSPSGRIALWPKAVNGVNAPLVSLDGEWKFALKPPSEPYDETMDISVWNDVQVPGELTLQGFDIESGKPSLYARTFSVPRDYEGNAILLRFEGVQSDARVWVNGIFVGSHCGPATVWDCDITRAVTPGRDAMVTVEVVDNGDDPSILSRYARHNTGGILRSVSVMVRPVVHLSHLHVNATLADDGETGILNIDAAVSGAEGRAIDLLVNLAFPDGHGVAVAEAALDLKRGKGAISLSIPKVWTWDAEHPRLYTLSCRLIAGGAWAEELEEKIGFRRITYGGKDGSDSRKVYVNGKQVKLRGVNLHDYSWDRGRVTSAEMNERDVAQLKSCNVNYVRTSHYPPPKALVEACDRLGIYLEVETAICFQHGILDQEQKNRYLSRFVEMVEAYRNHPSVLIWSLGNESSWNEGISAEYDWIKANDTTRPVKFSWPQTIFEEHAPMDIFSIHYVHFMDGFNATHAVAVGDFPCLHDEIAHVSCNNLVEMRRDPNVHNFWGESIKRHWEAIYATEGALGCAIWEAKDDIFYLPDSIRQRHHSIFNDTNGMGGWGCIWDSLGRLKPEAWLVKKAYSPILIDQRTFTLPEPDGAVEVPIFNRFDHTALSELTMEWQAGSANGTSRLPDLQPGEGGSFFLPTHPWIKGEELVLRFIGPDGVMADEHHLIAGELDPISVSVAGPAPLCHEDAEVVTLTSGETRLIVDKGTGKIRELAWRGEKVMTGGPHLHLTGINPGAWKLSENGVRIERRAEEIALMTTGSYGTTPVAISLSLSGNGILAAAYELLDQPTGRRELSEVGLSFDLPVSVDGVRWHRTGLWTAYPEDHIGRDRGLAKRIRSGAREHPDQFGIPQPWPWKDDMRDFYLHRRDDESDGWATNDFRSMKEHVLFYEVGFAGVDKALRILPEGDAACRMIYGPGRDPLVHVSDGDVTFEGPWERIPLVGYNGSLLASKQAGASVTLTFEGSGVRIYGLRQAVAALMRVLVDGKAWAMIDPSQNSVGAESSVEALCEIGDLTEGMHTLKLTVADSHGGTLAVNVFEVRRSPSRKPQASLIIDQQWNYPQLDWGNFMKPPLRLEKGTRGSVRMRMV